MLETSPLTITTRASVREALDHLNRTGQGVLLLVDDAGRLRRTITDGDVRRLLLGGAGLESKLEALPEQSPFTAPEGVTAAQALALMNEKGIDHLPMIDAQGRPTELLLRHELDSKILLSTPHLGEDELVFVKEAFTTNWIAPLGPNVDAFEREIAATVGMAHAAALSSGTAALHLALRLLGIGPGDDVYCSTLTFVASVNPVLYEGGTPVFIDSEPGSWNMSPSALEIALRDGERRGRLPKAVVIVNLYGQSSDMEPLLALCRRYGVAVVEDAAESLGATYRGRPSGSFGDVSALSFNGNKIITTSGGGMLVANDGALIERARFLSTQARDPTPWYEHSVSGFNYRMSNVLAGIGRGQLRVLSQRVAARRAVFERYRQALAPFTALEWMPEASFGTSTRWLSVCTLDPALSMVTPESLIAALARSGIEARRVWKPMHLQPLFAGCRYYRHDDAESFSDRAFERGVCLPSGSNMAPLEQERIIRALEHVLRRGERRAVAAAH
jgi:dTDP-4-amino-4,6-dideoxygalactose transaminase